ncbi:MAG: TonB-dependent receptor [Bacteroidetes bacterium]|nr:TonB-dependent receptor [Bacteroidota bacterium]
MKVNRILLITFFILFNSIVASAQESGEVKGIVRDGIKGDAIISANIYVVEAQRGSTSDFDGFYTINNLREGSYTLICTYIGYDSAKIVVNIKQGQTVIQNIFLTQKSETLNTAEVKGKKNDRSIDPTVSKVTIDAKDIKRLPAMGGAPDIAQYLQILPGVVFTGDQGGQLYIRGGSPVMNKILLDGMTIYNPFHSIGLFSVFDADLIKTADVYSAGFGAEYGDRISAIVDIKTRDGNKTQHGGNINLGPFLSKISLEGPLKSFVQGSGSSSYVLSIKKSYLEQSAPIFYSYANSDKLPYNFTDIYAKTSFHSPNGSSLKLFGFRFDDRVNFPNSTNYHWVSNGFGSRFVFIPESTKTKIDGFVAYSDYMMTQIESDGKPRKSGVGGFNLGINFTSYLKRDEFRYGLEVNGFNTDFEIFNSNGRRITQDNINTEIAGFVLYKYIRHRFLFDAGLRLQEYASLGSRTIEPRVSAKYNISRKVRFKAASGMYSQNLMSAISDRDVVNLFYGFLSGPNNLPAEFDGHPVTSRLQKSWHLVSGFEFELTDNIEINVEGFYKGFPQLTNINRDKLFDDIPAYADKPDSQKKDFIVESGDAYGGDFTFKYESKKFYFWAVYSITWVDRFDGVITYPTHWDRRHNVNTLLAYTPDKKKTWSLNLRWNLGSGFPFTQSVGYYEKLDFQSQGIGTNYLSNNGDLGILYGQLNGGRLPYYHRLDFSAEKIFYKKKNTKVWAVFSITNVYNRNNVFYFDRVSFTRVDQLPILPSLSINANF